MRGTLQPIYNPNPFFVALTKLTPRPTYAHVREGIKRLAPDFLAGGTTTLLEAHLNSPEELRAYAQLQAQGELPLRIFYTYEIDPHQSLETIADYLRTVSFAAGRGFGTDQLKVVGVSIGLDGPYWHGAAVNDAPYTGPFGQKVAPEPLVGEEMDMGGRHPRALSLARSLPRNAAYTSLAQIPGMTGMQSSTVSGISSLSPATPNPVLAAVFKPNRACQAESQTIFRSSVWTSRVP